MPVDGAAGPSQGLSVFLGEDRATGAGLLRGVAGQEAIRRPRAGQGRAVLPRTGGQGVRVARPPGEGGIVISEWARKRAQGLVTPLARLIARTGITPTGLTVAGFVLNAGVAWVLALGHLRLGGLLVLLAGAFDALDGALARLTDRVTPFGAFLDSTLDRCSEAALYLGLLAFYAGRGSRLELILIYLTMVGSLLVSYTRAHGKERDPNAHAVPARTHIHSHTHTQIG
ncbi:MAG TPA: CDP-alcohol phosphatidyltransferase family protein, partial [Anaerolineae bacterium]|nr:CDP-alcohol phosphatidyltransferase family protein [Anaerolineae bacterium]